MRGRASRRYSVVTERRFDRETIGNGSNSFSSTPTPDLHLGFVVMNLEEQMIHLAATEGNWLKDMLLERLGLMEWRVIEGGQSEPA